MTDKNTRDGALIPPSDSPLPGIIPITFCFRIHPGMTLHMDILCTSRLLFYSDKYNDPLPQAKQQEVTQ